MREQDFIDLVTKHRGIVEKIIFFYATNEQDRQDLRQEVYLQAWKSVKSFKGSSQFSTWLYRVALNTSLGFTRKKRVDTLPLEQAYFQKSNTVNHAEEVELLIGAIRQLNKIDRMIMILHLEDYTHEEIAAITGMTKNNVTVRLHRQKEKLKDMLNAR